MRVHVAVFGAILVSACGERVPTWDQDVQSIVARSCSGCHTPGGIAPFAFNSYADVYGRRDLIYTQVQSRKMPPWPPSASCAEYLGDRSLPENDRAALLSWLDHGAPAGASTGTSFVSGSFPAGLSRVDHDLQIGPSAYTPIEAPDEYRCFVLDWPETERRFVTGFSAKPGNATIVHHVLAFLATPDQAAQFQALDDADAAPGYKCFGGPGGTANALGGWVPGSLGGDFPQGTGVPVDPGSKLILQVHYNLARGLGASDRTAIQLKVDTQVAKPAFLLPWADPSWINSGTMRIPAGDPDVKHSFAFAPGNFLARITGNVLANGKFTLYGAALHQHLRGTKSRIEIQRAPGGAPECVLDIPRWDFHWQGGYTLKTPKTVDVFDRLSIECHWDNSARNQPDGLPPRELNWGERTQDEMCIGFLYITQ